MSAQHQSTQLEKAHVLAQLQAQLEDSSRRFSRLELDALDTEKLVLTDVQKQRELFKDSNQSAVLIQKNLEQFEVHLNLMKIQIRELSLAFKELIKQESVNELGAKIDSWPLEQFITRKEFSKLLEKEEE